MKFSSYLLALGIAAHLAGCRKPPREEAGPAAPAPAASAGQAPLDDKWTWRARSSSGAATLQQRGRSAVDCEASCAREGAAPAWTLEACLAGRDDFKFLAEDCGTVLVLLEYPARTERWETAPVLFIYRGGKPAGDLRAGQIVSDAAHLKENGAHFRWLAGVLGEEGRAPEYLPTGLGVALETVDRRPVTLLFADVRPPTLEAPAPAQAAAPSLFEYEDEQGASHFVQGLANVPPQYRKRAHAVESDVSVVAGDKQRPGPQPPQFGWQPRPQPPPQRPPAARPRPSDGVERNELGETPMDYAKRIGGPLPFKETSLRPPEPQSCRGWGETCRGNKECCTLRCIEGRCD